MKKLFLLAALILPFTAAASTDTELTGGSVTINVTVGTGTPPFTYQWMKNGAQIIGATNALITLPSLTTNDSATYTCKVTNAAGATTSDNAVLTVTPPPVVAPANVITSFSNKTSSLAKPK